mmetsp:Transcript_7786/g.13110  ORF Transcript_7786/g.13110 Transcript_7786/m.13110 type:complete len:201 (+) Transcript_7786:501-1103(+)
MARLGGVRLQLRLVDRHARLRVDVHVDHAHLYHVRPRWRSGARAGRVCGRPPGAGDAADARDPSGQGAAALPEEAQGGGRARRRGGGRSAVCRRQAPQPAHHPGGHHHDARSPDHLPVPDRLRDRPEPRADLPYAGGRVLHALLPGAAQLVPVHGREGRFRGAPVRRGQRDEGLHRLQRSELPRLLLAERRDLQPEHRLP